MPEQRPGYRQLPVLEGRDPMTAGWRTERRALEGLGKAQRVLAVVVTEVDQGTGGPSAVSVHDLLDAWLTHIHGLGRSPTTMDGCRFASRPPASSASSPCRSRTSLPGCSMTSTAGSGPRRAPSPQPSATSTRCCGPRSPRRCVGAGSSRTPSLWRPVPRCTGHRSTLLRSATATTRAMPAAQQEVEPRSARCSPPGPVEDLASTMILRVVARDQLSAREVCGCKGRRRPGVVSGHRHGSETDH